MKLPVQLQYKIQIGIALTLLMVAIVINSLSSRHNISLADSSVAAIYNDRLLAATYLFELTNNLHEKERKTYNSQRQTPVLDKNITLLIEKYERTMLTDQESVLWLHFKENLNLYDQSGLHEASKTLHFEKATHTLKALSALQAKEGGFLYKNTRSSLSATAFGTYLEIVLAILTGIAVLFSYRYFKENPR